MDKNELKITPELSCSVKIMLSYDYNHFEVSLQKSSITSLDEANELRKSAQRLADYAVEQYKIAKDKMNMRNTSCVEKRRLMAIVEQAEKKPKSELTAVELAYIKQLKDEAYWSQNDYDYEDDDVINF